MLTFIIIVLALIISGAAAVAGTLLYALIRLSQHSEQESDGEGLDYE